MLRRLIKMLLARNRVLIGSVSIVSCLKRNALALNEEELRIPPTAISFEILVTTSQVTLEKHSHDEKSSLIEISIFSSRQAISRCSLSGPPPRR